jgi:hypothetical protein
MPGWVRTFWALAGMTRTSRMAWKKSRSHALWIVPVGLSKGGGVPGKTAHNVTIGGPDLERYHKRLTWLPAEHCGFHPRLCAEAGGYRRRLHWILSYVYIFLFKKVHVKIISIMFALEIQMLWPFLNAYLLPTHPVECMGPFTQGKLLSPTSQEYLLLAMQFIPIWKQLHSSFLSVLQSLGV